MAVTKDREQSRFVCDLMSYIYVWCPTSGYRILGRAWAYEIQVMNIFDLGQETRARLKPSQSTKAT